MRYLLDTSALLFWLAGSKRLSPAVRAKLERTSNVVYVSAVSAFEIAVKVALGRLVLPDTPARVLPPFLAAAGLAVLDVTMHHGYAVADLPMHHRDPFDRLLVAQARCEDLTLVTSDAHLTAYPIEVLLFP